MPEENAALYKAYAARDARFDGVFYIGVTSTGIYCRPICVAKTPKPSNCRFFKSAAAAEKERFRPCLRCRPELAPGIAPVDDSCRIAHAIARRLDESPGEEIGIDDLADQFELSPRQIRRIMQQELGVSPIEFIITRRLLLAKQLLTDTGLPVTEIAFASGFSSLRRFNDAFKKRYGLSPSGLRKNKKPSGEGVTLQLHYRPPFDWQGLLGFLKNRLLKGAEIADGDSYARTVEIGKHKGWVRVRNAEAKHALLVDISAGLSPAIPLLLAKLRALFDLNSRPDVIAAHLRQDKRLAAIVAQQPGLRVPGAFDGFELAVRAVLGQQVTVKAATTLAGRFVQTFGEKIETPFPALTHLCPTPGKVAHLSAEDIAALGIIGSRSKSIIALAREASAGRLVLESGADPEATIKKLTALPGIGAWTAHYIAMRALRWPDAFPKEDIALRKILGGVKPLEAEALSQAWRPWRSYAVLHLWKSC